MSASHFLFLCSTLISIKHTLKTKKPRILGAAYSGRAPKYQTLRFKAPYRAFKALSILFGIYIPPS